MGCKLNLLPGLIIPYTLGALTGDTQVSSMALDEYFKAVSQCEISEQELISANSSSDGTFE